MLRYYRDPRLPVFELKYCRGEIHAERGHAHEEYSLGLVCGGASLVSYGRERCVVSSGTAVLIPPEVVHDCAPMDVGAWELWMLYLQRSWMERALGGCAGGERPCLRTPSGTARGHLCRLFPRLLEEIPALKKEALLIDALQHFGFTGGGMQRSGTRHDLVPAGVRAAGDYLRERCLDTVTLDDLASISGLSKYHLLRNFKRTYKIPPHAYQIVLRINHAKTALRSGRATVAAVAQDTGFYDESHFIRVFRQHTGATPAEYRAGRRKM